MRVTNPAKEVSVNNVTKTIKAVLGFARIAPESLLPRANAVYDGMNGNKAFPSPPIDIVAFKAAIDGLTAATAAALDGGNKAIVERNHLSAGLVKMLRQLAHYVEANCNDDLNTFVSSGFQAAPATRTPFKPLSQFFRRIDPGPNSGQLLVTIAAVANASSYELRWAAAGTGGTPGVWTVQPLTKARPAVTVSGLTPGATYVFQVRSLTESGYSDWSDSVTKICT